MLWCPCRGKFFQRVAWVLGLNLRGVIYLRLLLCRSAQEAVPESMQLYPS